MPRSPGRGIAHFLVGVAALPRVGAADRSRSAAPVRRLRSDARATPFRFGTGLVVEGICCTRTATGAPRHLENSIEQHEASIAPTVPPPNQEGGDPTGRWHGGAVGRPRTEGRLRAPRGSVPPLFLPGSPVALRSSTPGVAGTGPERIEPSGATPVRRAGPAPSRDAESAWAPDPRGRRSLLGIAPTRRPRRRSRAAGGG